MLGLFDRRHIFATDFTQANIVTMYLLPSLNLKLRPTLLDMKPGTRVVSHAFTMGDWEPDETATPEGRQVFPFLSVRQNLEMGLFARAGRTGVGDELERIQRWFPRLLERSHQQAGLLSGGEQQRLAIARALVFKPDWLFLDEATASLDESAAEEMYAQLKRQLPGATIVSIGHSLALRKWHDRTLELQREPGKVGKLVEVPA